MTSPQLNALQTRQYRSVVMRAAYLSQDRPDLSCSTKELARDMQKSTEQSVTNLKRLGRYLKKRPRPVQLFVEQASTTNVVRLDVYGDSDHAGCLKTRKSTTGMVLMHIVSKCQVTRNQPSHSVVVKVSIMGLSDAQPLAYARSMLSDFGMCADVVIRTDSPSGLAVGSRRGLGRLRHVQTRYFWVQQRVQEGDFRLKKEPGDTNVSDALTKPLNEKRMLNLLTMMGCEFRKRTNIVGARGTVTIDIVFSNMVFQQYGVFSSKIVFEASGVAQWYSGARIMNKAQTMILVRQSEQSARVMWTI